MTLQKVPKQVHARVLQTFFWLGAPVVVGQLMIFRHIISLNTAARKTNFLGGGKFQAKLKEATQQTILVSFLLYTILHRFSISA